MVESGSVQSEGDIRARDIITGLKIDNLTVVMTGLDELSQIVSQDDYQLHLTETGVLEAGSGEQPLLTLPPNVLEAFRQLSHAIDLSPDERHRAYAAWLVTRRATTPVQHAAQERYIRLKATMTAEQAGLVQRFTGWYPQPGGPPQARKLDDVTEAINDHPAFVLLGAPGSGKTTVLYRLRYQAARDFLQNDSQRLPLWVTLAGYRWEGEDPLTYIQRQWQANIADDLIEMIRAGQVLLLIDGLNEMRRLQSYRDHQQRVNDWEHFLQDYFSDTYQDNRAIVASRTADYEQTLDLPRVEINPLDDEQINLFLQAYLGEEADGALAAIQRLELLDLARVPYSLAILTDLYESKKSDLPPNQGRLFATYADKMLLAEKKQTDLPLEAARLALNQLGYQMQEAGESTVLPAEEIEALIPTSVQLPTQRRPVETPPPAVFDLACQANLLSLDPGAEQASGYKFTHHLLQEQFAAADMLRRWQMGQDLTEFWRTARFGSEMPAPDTGEWDPLPTPPPTGWEQTTMMAAGLLDWADTFVRAVQTVNPALAGRCLTEGAANVNLESRSQIGETLLKDLRDSDLDRRARLEAGQVLGALGDPRFEPVMIGESEVILPDLVEVPGGTATLGSDDSEAHNDEQPVHQVEVAPFYLARYPVTNAEYGCFIKAGGYDNEQYWTPIGWQWRQGELEESGPIEDWLNVREAVVQNPNLPVEWFEEGRLTPGARDTWQAIGQMSEDELRQVLAERFAPQTRHQSAYWDDPTYNGSNQPVVGVTWYEAMAYCAWLNARIREAAQADMGNAPWPEIQSQIANHKSKIRLPSEAEWEWAAGGPEHSRYPWGKRLDVDKANTLEGRVLKSSPVGAYPAGAATCEALDMSGNVYEWTHSLYRDYPYQIDDGREDPLVEGRWVLRGGSWLISGRDARVSARYGTLPATSTSATDFVSWSPLSFPSSGCWLLVSALLFSGSSIMRNIGLVPSQAWSLILNPALAGRFKNSKKGTPYD